MAIATITDLLGYERISRIYDVFYADTRRCSVSLSERYEAAGEIDQFWARTFVRTFISWVEANTYEFKTIVLRAHATGFARLQESDAGALSEEVWELNDRARPHMH